MKTFIIICGIALGVLAVCIRHRQPNKRSEHDKESQKEQTNQNSLSIIDRIKNLFETKRQSLEEKTESEFVEVLRLPDVVYYFKSLHLRKGHDIPFIANAKHPMIQSMLKTSNDYPFALCVGTYNEDTNEVENFRFIETNELDDDVKSILGDEPIVVLS